MIKFLMVVAALFLGCAAAYGAASEDGAVRMHSGESVKLYAGTHTLHCERHNRAMRKSFKTNFEAAAGEVWTASCAQGRVRFELESKHG